MVSIGNANTHGDRLDGPTSEPYATLKSSLGFKGRITWDTPTTVAPIARAAFTGGSSDSVPTVTPITAAQSRIATVMHKRRFMKNAGKHYIPSNQTPKSGNRDVISSSRKSGNLGDKTLVKQLTTILGPPNQEDTNITSRYPNPIEPLPATNPIEQQGNQLSNFRGNLRIPMESRDFPYLSKSRGLERNLDGVDPVTGNIFATEGASGDLETIANAIEWS